MPTSERKIFAALFCALFTAVAGVGIVVPLLPVYARQMGAGGVAIGLVFGSFTLARSLCLPYFGRLSDRRGRKPLIVGGLLAYSLVSLAFLAVGSVGGLVAVRFLQGIASAMMMPVILAYAGEITPAGREGRNMGLFNSALFLGLSLGPLIGGAVKDHLALDAAFLAMGGLALVGLTLCLGLLPPAALEINRKPAHTPVPWSFLIRDRTLAALVFFRFAYAAGIGVLWGFLPLLADAELALSSLAIGLLVTTGVLASGLTQIPMGYAADRVGRRGLVMSGGALAAGALLAFEWAAGFGGLLAACLVFGLGGGIAMPALMAMTVQQGKRSAAMGAVMALLTLAHSLGMLAGAMLAGMAMDLLRLRHAFPIGALLMAAGMAVFWAGTLRREGPGRER
jgi:MFS family permease